MLRKSKTNTSIINLQLLLKKTNETEGNEKDNREKNWRHTNINYMLIYYVHKYILYNCVNCKQTIIM